MKIWLLQTGEPLPLDAKVRKLRTALLADKLTGRGHDVLWWASALDHTRKEMLFAKDTDVQVHPKLVIKALKGIPYQRNVSIRRYVDHRIIAQKFRRLAPRLPRPDVIVAATPDYHLAYEAVMLARRENIPVVVDIRDQWPDTFLEVIPRWLVPVARVALWDDFRKLRTLLKMADSLTSMVSNLLDWGLEYAEREATWKDKVFYLGAPKPPAPRETAADEFSGVLDRLKGKFVVTYIGTFGTYNNPLVLVRAARHLNEMIGPDNNYVFVIAGNGVLYEATVSEAKGLNNIVLPGWLDGENVASLLATSSVGVIPWSEVAYAFPIKSFTYLSAGLPVIASVEGDLKDLLSQYRIGFHFEPNDYRRLAELLKQMRDHPDHLAEMSKNVRVLYDERLDADKIYKAFADHIEKIASASSKP